ncbi:hypothetical protein E2C01_094671 [Portunus trituberculatus]|uniref:Uncharacterized protein n=1 Tax=Portunus trituberculatus TaxID=210409 RepID=A0A5B7K1G5_PORTR|nr:hypothetical protein [Portunus trituberculatus]
MDRVTRIHFSELQAQGRTNTFPLLLLLSCSSSLRLASPRLSSHSHTCLSDSTFPTSTSKKDKHTRSTFQ